MKFSRKSCVRDERGGTCSSSPVEINRTRAAAFGSEVRLAAKQLPIRALKLHYPSTTSNIEGDPAFFAFKLGRECIQIGRPLFRVIGSR